MVNYDDMYAYVERNRRFLEKSGDIQSPTITFIGLDGSIHHSALSRQKSDEKYLKTITHKRFR